MSLPVTAKHDLDANIMDTTIVVKIPKGTEGEIVQEVRKDIVIVQFDVPSLGVLRVNRGDLLIKDSIEVIANELDRIRNIRPFIEKDVHRDADELLVRALNHLKTSKNAKHIDRLIRIYNEIPKHYQ